MNKALLIALLALIVIGAVISILQVWGVGIGWALYVKLMITIGILTLLIGLVLVIKSDFGDYKKMKDGNFLD